MVYFLKDLDLEPKDNEYMELSFHNNTIYDYSTRIAPFFDIQLKRKYLSYLIERSYYTRCQRFINIPRLNSRCRPNSCMIESLLIDTIKTILLHIIITNTLIKHNNPAI